MIFQFLHSDIGGCAFLVDQPTNQDASLTDVVTDPQSVQTDVRPKQYQATCPSYNELLREMRKYDLDNRKNHLIVHIQY